jgi:hypothetical protein
VCVGIVGAGGKKEDGDGMTPKMLEKMSELVPLVLRHHFQLTDLGNLELAGSGGPFGGDIALQYWLSGALEVEVEADGDSKDVADPDRIAWRALHLYLPAPFVNGRYDDASKDPATRTAASVYNQLHAQYSRQLGRDTLVDVASAILLEAQVHVHAGFLKRDERLAEACDILVAFTWGDSGTEPKAGSGGAARQTWDYCRGKKLHIRLRQLDAELAHYKQLHSRSRPSSASSSASRKQTSLCLAAAPASSAPASSAPPPRPTVAGTVKSPAPPPISALSSLSLPTSSQTRTPEASNERATTVPKKAVNKNEVAPGSDGMRPMLRATYRDGSGGVESSERSALDGARSTNRNGKRAADARETSDAESGDEAQSEADVGNRGAKKSRSSMSAGRDNDETHGRDDDDDDGYHTDDCEQIEYAENQPPRIGPSSASRKLAPTRPLLRAPTRLSAPATTSSLRPSRSIAF